MTSMIIHSFNHLRIKHFLVSRTENETNNASFCSGICQEMESVCIITSFPLWHLPAAAQSRHQVRICLWFRKALIIRVGALEATKNIQRMVSPCALSAMGSILIWLPCVVCCISLSSQEQKQLLMYVLCYLSAIECLLNSSNSCYQTAPCAIGLL